MAAASHLEIWGPNLYVHPKRFFEFSSNFHPPGNLVANRLFRAMGAGFWADLDLAGGSEAMSGLYRLTIYSSIGSVIW